jgi:rSAM/selenodomain-associated transferase 1
METRFKVPVWDQVGDDLGTRMAAAFKRALDSPYRSAVVIGTDIPGITSTFLKMAGKNLEDYDVVLGPTVDGGYYLIGLRTPMPELFEDIPWSTNRVFALTELKIREMGLKLKVLPMLRDLDTVEDLHVFIQEAKDRKNQAFSSRTKGVLQELAKRIER